MNKEVKKNASKVQENSREQKLPIIEHESAKLVQKKHERIRAIEAKAIRKLQHPVCSRMLEGFLSETDEEK